MIFVKSSAAAADVSSSTEDFDKSKLAETHSKRGIGETLL